MKTKFHSIDNLPSKMKQWNYYKLQSLYFMKVCLVKLKYYTISSN